jgi:hypothetical protein
MLSQEAEIGVKCKWKRGMGFEPALYGWSPIRGMIVNDEMEIENGGGLLVDQSKKAHSMFSAVNREVVPSRL